VSASEEVSVVALSTTGVNIGSPISIEKIIGEKGLIPYTITKNNEITIKGRHVNFKGDDQYFQEEIGYLYRFFSNPYSIKMGIGSIKGDSYIEEPSEKIDIAFYYGYAETELRLEDFSVIGNLKIGLTDKGVKVVSSGAIRFGEELRTHLLLGYSNYSIYGTKGFLEFNISATENISPMLGVVVEKVPTDVISSTQFLTGIKCKISEGVYLKPIVGFGGRNTSCMGLAFNLDTSFNF